MRGLHELVTVKGLRSLDATRTPSVTATTVIAIIFIQDTGPRDSTEPYQWPHSSFSLGEKWNWKEMPRISYA